MIKRSKTPQISLAYSAEEQSFTPSSIAAITAIFEDDDEKLQQVRQNIIDKTPTLTVITGHKKSPKKAGFLKNRIR